MALAQVTRLRYLGRINLALNLLYQHQIRLQQIIQLLQILIIHPLHLFNLPLLPLDPILIPLRRIIPKQILDQILLLLRQQIQLIIFLRQEHHQYILHRLPYIIRILQHRQLLLHLPLRPPQLFNLPLQRLPLPLSQHLHPKPRDILYLLRLLQQPRPLPIQHIDLTQILLEFPLELQYLLMMSILLDLHLLLKFIPHLVHQAQLLGFLILSIVHH